MDMTIHPPQEATGMPARTEMLRMGSRRSRCMVHMLLPHLTRYRFPRSPASSSDCGTSCANMTSFSEHMAAPSPVHQRLLILQSLASIAAPGTTAQGQCRKLTGSPVGIIALQAGRDANYGYGQTGQGYNAYNNANQGYGGYGGYGYGQPGQGYGQNGPNQSGNFGKLG